MKDMKVTKPTTPSRTFTQSGKQCGEFDCTFEYLPIPNGGLYGISMKLPSGTDWRDILRARNVAQDPRTKLYSVPATMLPSQVGQYAQAGVVQSAIFPDDINNIGEIHILAGPPANVTKVQNDINQEFGPLML